MKNEYLDNLITSAEEGKQLSDGERDVAWAYKRSAENGFDVITWYECMWENEVEAVVQTLRAAGINELYVTSQASNMLGVYLMLDELGLKLRGVVRLDNPKCKADMERWGRSIWDETIPAMKLSF